MPALSNPKHERFAQELAKGKSASEAYVTAGYAPNDGNASTLKGNQRILDRLAELQERAAIRTELTIASITEDLMRIARKGEELAEASGLAVARAAVMDAAKINGLVVERNENVNINHDVTDEPLSDEQWEERHAAQTVN